MLAVAAVVHALGLLVVFPEFASTDRIERGQIRLFRSVFELPVEPAGPPQQSEAATSETAASTTESAEEEVHLDVVEEPLSARQLMQQTLLQAGASGPVRPPERSIIDGSPVPRLPGQSGWLNDFIGNVGSEHHTWLDSDGASSARIVNASGQVYCGHRRAPSTAEEFNHWMSAALMLWKSCGRQRPEPVDTQDPWQRGGGILP